LLSLSFRYPASWLLKRLSNLGSANMKVTLKMSLKQFNPLKNAHCATQLLQLSVIWPFCCLFFFYHHRLCETKKEGLFLHRSSMALYLSLCCFLSLLLLFTECRQKRLQTLARSVSC